MIQQVQQVLHEAQSLINCLMHPSRYTFSLNGLLRVQPCDQLAQLVDALRPRLVQAGIRLIGHKNRSPYLSFGKRKPDLWTHNGIIGEQVVERVELRQAGSAAAVATVLNQAMPEVDPRVVFDQHPDLQCLKDAEKRTVVILRGLQGTGKSFLAKAITQQCRVHTVICSADVYFIRKDNGSYQFDATRLEEAHRYCFSRFQHALQQHVSLVIVDNTNIRYQHVRKYCEAATLEGYNVCIYELESNHPINPLLRSAHPIPLTRKLFPPERIPVSEFPNLQLYSMTVQIPRRGICRAMDTSKIEAACVVLSRETQQRIYKRFQPIYPEKMADHIDLQVRPTEAFIKAFCIGKALVFDVISTLDDGISQQLQVKVNGKSKSLIVSKTTTAGLPKEISISVSDLQLDGVLGLRFKDGFSTSLSKSYLKSF